MNSLIKRLNNVQSAIDAATVLEKAEKAVAKAKVSKTQSDYDAAIAL